MATAEVSDVHLQHKIAFNNETLLHFIELYRKHDFLLSVVRRSKSNTQVTNAALSSIGKINYLKKLTLHDIPQHIDGQFLITICKSCQHLTSLNIKLASRSNSFHNNVCLALPYTVFLKDFRYEFSFESINGILEALGNIKNQNLERVSLKGSETTSFSELIFQTFLTKNTQLVLLSVVLRNSSKQMLQCMSKIAHKFKIGSEKVFLFTNDESIYVGSLPLPYIHRREMVEYNSVVCGINIFNDFTKG